MIVTKKSPLQVWLNLFHLIYLNHLMSMPLILLLVLEFMHCGMMVDDKRVTTDIAESLMYSISEIRDVLNGKYRKIAQRDAIVHRLRSTAGLHARLAVLAIL